MKNRCKSQALPASADGMVVATRALWLRHGFAHAGLRPRSQINVKNETSDRSNWPDWPRCGKRPELASSGDPSWIGVELDARLDKVPRLLKACCQDRKHDADDRANHDGTGSPEKKPADLPARKEGRGGGAQALLCENALLQRNLGEAPVCRVPNGCVHCLVDGIRPACEIVGDVCGPKPPCN